MTDGPSERATKFFSIVCAEPVIPLDFTAPVLVLSAETHS
jgi:hypothetical protein